MSSRDRFPDLMRSALRCGEGKECDWWVLLLDGPGTFGASKDGAVECEDISHALPHLPSAEPACFGHAWVPTWRLHEIDAHQLPLMGGLLRRVSEAVASVTGSLSESLHDAATQSVSNEMVGGALIGQVHKSSCSTCLQSRFCGSESCVLSKLWLHLLLMLCFNHVGINKTHKRLKESLALPTGL